MLKLNMFVRCSIETEVLEEPRDFATGKIISINEYAETAEVAFYDINKIKQYYQIPEIHSYRLDELLHCSVRSGAVVEYNNTLYSIQAVEFNKEDEFYYYYLSNKTDSNFIKVCETELKVGFNDGKVSPLRQMMNYEFQQPAWFFGRRVVSEATCLIDNAMYGLREISGCKIQLMPHQLKTVMRCLQEPNCRFMLADEVGLGKTIEAISVLKVFMTETEKQNILILVPDSLIEQWKTELAFKFGIFTGMNPNGHKVTLLPLKSINNNLLSHSNLYYDFVIIDEAHRLLAKGEKISYINAMLISQRAKNILMLSATPIQSRVDEYHSLLKLIQPNKYKSMDNERFNELCSMQKRIIRFISSVFHLINDYTLEIEKSNNEHTEDIEDIFEDLIDDIEKIAEITNDKNISNLIEKTNYKEEDFGIDAIQYTLAYICETYQLEKCIIRNRNDGIKLNTRCVVPCSYDIELDSNNAENKVYRLLSEWIESLQLSPEIYKEHFLNLVSAFFSSANAFYDVLSKYNFVKVPNELLELAHIWVVYENEILKTLGDILSDDPENYRNRIISLIDYIDQEAYDEKILLFTNHNATFELYQKALKNYFGEECCCFFNKNMSIDEREKDTYRFQTDTKAKIMLSDETGGEGRNFQIASKVIHIDIPWSANDLEQRIGRLDRIGRKEGKAVISVVPFALNTIEEQLFKFWSDGVKIFNESQAGLEIIMPTLDNDIVNAICENFKYGLSNKINSEIIPKMEDLRKQVKEERHYDIAASKYQRTYRQIESTISKYNEIEIDLFGNSMMGWSNLSGFKGCNIDHNVIQFNASSFSPKSAQNTLFVPPNMIDIINSKMNQMQNHIRQLVGEKEIQQNPNVIRGTFDRKLSLENDYIHFFAPGDEIFDSIVNNALTSYKGRCSAFACTCDYNWIGLVFSWYMQPNERILIKNNISRKEISQYKGYLPSDIVYTVVPLKSDYDVSSEDVLDYLQEITNYSFSDFKKKVGNYGQRHLNKYDLFSYGERYGISNIEWFKEHYPKAKWENIVQNKHIIAKDKAKKQFEKKFNKEELRFALEEKLAMSKSAAKYFGASQSPEISKEYINIIYEAFTKSSIVLDSVCFLRLVKV